MGLSLTGSRNILDQSIIDLNIYRIISIFSEMSLKSFAFSFYGWLIKIYKVDIRQAHANVHSYHTESRYYHHISSYASCLCHNLKQMYFFEKMEGKTVMSPLEVRLKKKSIFFNETESSISNLQLKKYFLNQIETIDLIYFF